MILDCDTKILIIDILNGCIESSISRISEKNVTVHANSKTINSPPHPPPLPPTRAENVLCDRENLVKLKGCTIEYQNMPPVGRLNKPVQVSIQLPPPLPPTLPTPTKSLKTEMLNSEIIPKGFKIHAKRDKNKENIMMSKTPILKRWLETEKKEDQKFKLTKCVKFQEPTISTSKKRTKLTKKQKDLKKQSSCFKSYFSAKKQTTPHPLNSRNWCSKILKINKHLLWLKNQFQSASLEVSRICSSRWQEMNWPIRVWESPALGYWPIRSRQLVDYCQDQDKEINFITGGIMNTFARK